MHVSNNNTTKSEASLYVPNTTSKEIDPKAAVTFLADQMNSKSADTVKEELLKQINKDPLFMAGIGIKSLGYTFLLLQMYSELEVELIKNSNKQAMLTGQMYTELANTEKKIGEEMWSSGLAKGLSQITGALAPLIGSGLVAYKKNKITEEHKKEHKETYNIIAKEKAADSAATRGDDQPTARRPSINSDLSAQENSSPHGRARGVISSHAPNEKEANLNEELAKKLKGVGDFDMLIANSLNQISRGVGETAGSYYDSKIKEEEGLKHLIQMVIGSADAQKSRLQQQYEEAAKKMDEAIQAYNAAMNASH